MGYSITIGERTTERDEEVGEVWHDAIDADHPDTAPHWPGDELTGTSNARHPSYTGWGQFTDAVGLTELFHNKATGLMRNHPGCEPITTRHLDEVLAAQATYVAKWSEWTPGFDGPSVGYEHPGANLARLEWLVYWMRWAIDACDHPVIANG